MNKEEIEKAIKVVFNEECKKCYFPQKRKCTSCLKESKKIIKKYIQHLEQKEAILNKVTDKFSKMKQSIDKLKNRDGESMIMVDVCIQNIIAFYDDIEKILEGEKKE